MKKVCVFLLSFLLLFAFPTPSRACTSAIISGRLTPSGRPLLWKHRDTGTFHNHISYEKNVPYPFIYLEDREKAQESWTGTNVAGFSIMNTASYNLKDDRVPEKDMDKEGLFMYRALSICKDLEDFEHYLDTLSRPIGVEANFGVMDAKGGAAYYEVNNHKWVKFDVNDPTVAPLGYLVYTNHSFTGRFNDGSGYVRYQTAGELFMRQSAFAVFTPEWIFGHVSRSFYNSVMGVDLCRSSLVLEEGSGYFPDQDFISRSSSVSSIVIEGVKTGEDPLNTVMWTVMGYPPAGVAVPLWVKMGENQPDIMMAGKDGNAPLCEWAMALKNKTFPIHRGNGGRYMNFRFMYNKEGKGYMQTLGALEKELFVQYGQFLESTERNPSVKEIRELYQSIMPRIESIYVSLL